MNILKNILMLSAGILLSTALHAAPQNFEQAKAELRDHVYFDQNKASNLGTLYCGCEWDWRGRSGGVINPEKCGYQVRKQETRGQRIEYEHIVPAYNFGRARQCWQNGGRDNCQQNDPVFRAMEADMHNLTPTVGELNADRSNFRFGMLPTTSKQHGACSFKVDFKRRVVEIREEARGLVARVQFYMHDRYNLNMSRQQEQLFMAWHKAYPPSQWERQRDARIAKQMGHHNPFVTGEKVWKAGYRPSGEGAVMATIQVENQVGIRGNKNSRVYHLPEGCPSYNAMSPHNIVNFVSEAQALEAGYRKAGNCR